MPIYDSAGNELPSEEYYWNQWTHASLKYLTIGSIQNDIDIDLHTEANTYNWGDSLDIIYSGKEDITETTDVDERAKDEDGNKFPKVTLTSETNWSHMWTDLPADDGNGNTYYYYVKETAVDGEESNLAGYDTSVTNNGGIEKGTITVTNKSKTKIEYSSFSFTKKWMSSGETSEWKKDITVTLTGTLLNGESIISSKFTIHRNEDGTFTAKKEANGLSDPITTCSFAGSEGDNVYSFKFDNLPKKDKNGNEYTYTLKEETLEGYTASYKNTNDTGTTPAAESISTGGTITNTEQSGTPLPFTGGSGTTGYIAGGILLIAAAALLYIYNRKRMSITGMADNATEAGPASPNLHASRRTARGRRRHRE